MDKPAIAVCTCLVSLYLLDAAFFNGVYFVSAIRMISRRGMAATAEQRLIDHVTPVKQK